MSLRIRKSAEEIQEKISGAEPKFTGKEMTNGDMVQALNWYAINRDSKSSLKYATDYFKKNKIKVSQQALSSTVTTFGFLCRLKNNGAIFSEAQQQSFQKYMDYINNYVDVKVDDTKPKTNVITIQDRIDEKVREIIGDLEGSFDEFILSDYKKTFSPYALMQNRAKSIHASKIMEFYKKKRQEFDYVLNTDDKDIKEGYSNFNKPQLKKLVAICDSIISDCIKISGEVKQTRKPRKRKVKSPEQLVSKMVFCKEDNNYRLQSIDPKEVIRASQLWVFNTKNRKLGVYHAQDAQGLSVKGTSIINFAEDKSVMKTLRKPEETLPVVQNAGKVALRKVLDDIRSVEVGLTGRINKDIILLRVIK